MAFKVVSFLVLACQLALVVSPASADRMRGLVDHTRLPSRTLTATAAPLTAPSTVLTIAGAEAVIAAAVAHATSLKQTAPTIVVVDRNGDVVASRRGDGASAASYILATEKAYTAANTGGTTPAAAVLYGGAANGPLVVPAAGALQVPQFTYLPGGVPISRNSDAVIGGIGVDGTTADAAVATIGAGAITEA